jgi:hypothetical protein
VNLFGLRHYGMWCNDGGLTTESRENAFLGVRCSPQCLRCCAPVRVKLTTDSSRPRIFDVRQCGVWFNGDRRQLCWLRLRCCRLCWLRLRCCRRNVHRSTHTAAYQRTSSVQPSQPRQRRSCEFAILVAMTARTRLSDQERLLSRQAVGKSPRPAGNKVLSPSRRRGHCSHATHHQLPLLVLTYIIAELDAHVNMYI